MQKISHHARKYSFFIFFFLSYVQHNFVRIDAAVSLRKFLFLNTESVSASIHSHMGISLSYCVSQTTRTQSCFFEFSLQFVYQNRSQVIWTGCLAQLGNTLFSLKTKGRVTTLGSNRDPVVLQSRIRRCKTCFSHENFSSVLFSHVFSWRINGWVNPLSMIRKEKWRYEPKWTFPDALYRPARLHQQTTLRTRMCLFMKDLRSL